MFLKIIFFRNAVLKFLKSARTFSILKSCFFQNRNSENFFTPLFFIFFKILIRRAYSIKMEKNRYFVTRSVNEFFRSAPSAHKNTPRRSVLAEPRSVFVCARSGAKKTSLCTPCGEMYLSSRRECKKLFSRRCLGGICHHVECKSNKYPTLRV